MNAATNDIEVSDLFARALTAHLPPERFERLRRATVFVAGVGGGSNIAELFVRKGIGSLVLADPDVYEPHNIRQRGCSISSAGRNKVEVIAERLRDINPHVRLRCVPEGVTLENVAELVRGADLVVDMIDLHAVQEKIALYREARRMGKVVLTAPSVINGGVLWVFSPDGISYEEFCGFREGMPLAELAWRILDRFVGQFPDEAPASMYAAAARGERTIPLDAVGVDQASVMLVGAAENLLLGRFDRVFFVPQGLQVDASDPRILARVIDRSADFPQANAGRT